MIYISFSAYSAFQVLQIFENPFFFSVGHFIFRLFAFLSIWASFHKPHWHRWCLLKLCCPVISIVPLIWTRKYQISWKFLFLRLPLWENILCIWKIYSHEQYQVVLLSVAYSSKKERCQTAFKGRLFVLIKELGFWQAVLSFDING